jgi:stearoyl-CoA desaturase (delta-9 desaturase)
MIHCTGLINSAAHFFGLRPYNPDIPPAENRFASALSGGEGWHNYHHKYPFDYAASEFSFDKQFNTTKLFIDMCVKIGLAYNPRRAVVKKGK